MATYDAIVVGARVAGAGTALRLARAGHRVLVLDRARRGSDTLSTHALMRPAVLQLERLGLLDDVVASGTPGVDHVMFHYGDRIVRIHTSSTLYAPRRTVLDPLLVDAAERAGAEIRFGVDVRDLRRAHDGRVVGVQVRDEDGGTDELRARFTIGADGRRSRIAASLQPSVTCASTAATAFAYGYFAGVATDAYEWCYGPGSAGGLIPTTGGEVCVFTAVPAGGCLDEVRTDDGFLRALAATSRDVADRVAAGRRHGPIRGFPGLLGWLRRPWGPGWALVGDAGYFKDPSTAHGLTDALRDGELLSHALDAALTGRASAAEALGWYERLRDELSLPFFEITDRVASLAWGLDELQRLHIAMSEVQEREVEALDALEIAGAALVA